MQGNLLWWVQDGSRTTAQPDIDEGKEPVEQPHFQAFDIPTKNKIRGMKEFVFELKLYST